jgi:hypothetical protein
MFLGRPLGAAFRRCLATVRRRARATGLREVGAVLLALGTRDAHVEVVIVRERALRLEQDLGGARADARRSCSSISPPPSYETRKRRTRY